MFLYHNSHWLSKNHVPGRSFNFCQLESERTLLQNLLINALSNVSPKLEFRIFKSNRKLHVFDRFSSLLWSLLMSFVRTFSRVTTRLHRSLSVSSHSPVKLHVVQTPPLHSPSVSPSLLPPVVLIHGAFASEINLRSLRTREDFGMCSSLDLRSAVAFSSRICKM